MKVQEPTTKPGKLYTTKIVCITILSCAVIAGAIVYHIVSTRNQYLKGYSDGGNAVKNILIQK